MDFGSPIFYHYQSNKDHKPEKIKGMWPLAESNSSFFFSPCNEKIRKQCPEYVAVFEKKFQTKCIVSIVSFHFKAYLLFPEEYSFLSENIIID